MFGAYNKNINVNNNYMLLFLYITKTIIFYICLSCNLLVGKAIYKGKYIRCLQQFHNEKLVAIVA